MRHFLKFPAIYTAFGNFVGGNGRFEKVYVETHMRAGAGDKILDIGCGPASILKLLPEDCVYNGFDPSQAYIDSARQQYGPKATFTVSGVEENLIGAFPNQDLILATGVLHHLPDDLAQLLIRIAWSNLKPGGRLVTSDGCYCRDQPWLNRFVVSLDRGEFVRDADRFRQLASASFGNAVKLSVYHDLLRIPYSHAIMECTRQD